MFGTRCSVNPFCESEKPGGASTCRECHHDDYDYNNKNSNATNDYDNNNSIHNNTTDDRKHDDDVNHCNDDAYQH